MEATYPSETSVDDSLRTARLHIPGDIIVYNHRCESLK
jgi:hypothetical protein